MPPDDPFEGGRDRHVRDVTAPNFQKSSSPVFVKFPTPASPITPSCSPSSINRHSLGIESGLNSIPHVGDVDPSKFNQAHSVYSTSRSHPSPLLTPCSSSDSLSLSSTQSSIRHHTPPALTTIFPNGLQDVEAIHDISSKLPPALEGVIVDRPSGIRTVYILGLTSSVSLDHQVRDIVVRVLDLADEEIEADEVVFALEKQHDRLRELLQGLLYVGGAVVKNPQHETVNEDLVLVGIEI